MVVALGWAEGFLEMVSGQSNCHLGCNRAREHCSEGTVGPGASTEVMGHQGRAAVAQGQWSGLVQKTLRLDATGKGRPVQRVQGTSRGTWQSMSRGLITLCREGCVQR